MGNDVAVVDGAGPPFLLRASYFDEAENKAMNLIEPIEEMARGRS